MSDKEVSRKKKRLSLKQRNIIRRHAIATLLDIDKYQKSTRSVMLPLSIIEAAIEDAIRAILQLAKEEPCPKRK